MDDELKLLLKLILEREEKAEEEKKTAKKRGRPVSEPAVTEKQPEKEETGKLPHTQAEYRERDLTLARRELYPAHDSNIDLMKDVPIWAKYALTVRPSAPSSGIYSGIRKGVTMSVIKTIHTTISLRSV